MAVRVLKDFNYPTSRTIRDKIRAFHRNKANDGRSWSGDRGLFDELTTGQVILSPPPDLAESWLRDGLVEEVV